MSKISWEKALKKTQKIRHLLWKLEDMIRSRDYRLSTGDALSESKVALAHLQETIEKEIESDLKTLQAKVKTLEKEREDLLLEISKRQEQKD